ncbi:MAG: ribonuclease P protein component [Gammaproteobacteria bacterium]|nr:ribonuclease P protein component [Gammaproteobacteria bacterium]
MHDSQEQKLEFQLPKRCRLTGSAQFGAVFSQHKKVSNRHFRILVRYKHDQSDSRIGIIVSRRVSRKAVNRNRIKRQLREAFRLNRHKLKNMDLIVIAHRICETATNDELSGSVNKLLRKLES